MVHGEAGVGKTALLNEAFGSASGLRVVRAAGVESEMELPFAGLQQLCVSMLGHLEHLPPPGRWGNSSASTCAWPGKPTSTPCRPAISRAVSHPYPPAAGAPIWFTGARRELAATGEKVRTRAADRPHDLTKQEAQSPGSPAKD
jgi:hypothetical protein